MKKLLLLLMVVGAVWVGLAWGDTAAIGASPFKSPQNPPKQVTKYTSHGEGAAAEFYFSDNCSSTYAYISAGESVSKGQGKPTESSTAFIYLSGYNSCTGTPLYAFTDVGLSADAFKMQGKLDSATLNTQVTICCDQNGSTFLATLNVTWTGTGPINKGKTSYTSKSPSCKITYKAQGESRNGTASGTITAPNLALTLQSPPWAILSSSTESNMQVGCD